MNSLSLILKGVFMGIADLVPGVSGGTIAFVLGIYEDFIFSLSKISISSIKKIKNNGVEYFWREINGGFLLKIFSGIIIGISLFTYLIDWLIINYKILLWSFFLGVLLSSMLFIYKKIKTNKFNLLLYFFFGILISFSITQINPYSEVQSISKIYLFLTSLIAISAMMLPGVSGAYILIIFGTYSEVILIIKGILNMLFFQDYTNANTILHKAFFVASGIVSGILIFSKIFKWLLTTHYDRTLIFLIGLMMGGLSKIWPWQENENPVLPSNYSGENYLLLSLVFFISGVLFISSIQFLEKKIYNAKKKINN